MKRESPYFGSLAEVADYFNRTARTIRRWIRQERIPHFRLDGGQVLFDRREIAAWIEAGRREPLPPQRMRKRAAAVPLSPSIFPEPPRPRGQKRTRYAALPPNFPAQ